MAIRDDLPRHPTTGFWITVALVVVLVAYPLSFGPACWVTSRTNVGASAVPIVYRPMTWAMSRSPVIANALHWSAGLGSLSYWGWVEVDQEWAWISRW